MKNTYTIRSNNSSTTMNGDGTITYESNHRGYPTQYWIDDVAKMEKVVNGAQGIEKTIFEGMLNLSRAALKSAIARDIGDIK